MYEPTKKGKFLEKETARLTKVGQVGTVIRIDLCIINPGLQSGVNNNLSYIVTVLTVTKFFSL